ncbi:MAG: DAK2 domain-containing protein [Clostridia bacterium]|nr:DAK2 domain-containing protein [Clostridia bacterium]
MLRNIDETTAFAMPTEKKEDQYLDGELLSRMARGGAAELRTNAEEVNHLNVFPVPDGDTGDNMCMTIESGVAALDKLEENASLQETAAVLSRGMLLGARGNSGVILSQFIAGMAKGLSNCEKANARIVGRALTEGVQQAYASVMTPTEGTILTVAREAVEYANARLQDNSTVNSYFHDLVTEMYRSLQRTPQILAVLREAGVVDSGGAGLFYIIDGFNRALNGEEIEMAELPAAGRAAATVDFSAFGPDSEMTYGYCTEFLLQLQTSKVADIEHFDMQEIIPYLESLGDSLVAFKTDSIVKVHVHTKTPEKVLEHCRRFGEFLTVKIENMSVQHSEQTVKEEPTEQADRFAAAAPVVQKKCAVVAVCNGEGMENLFREFGADAIVNGGQTQNPSTNDFLDAFATVSAEHIFVFPNNSNILMAARQAAELYDKATVHVVESRDVGAGYVALSAADFTVEDVNEILDCIASAMAGVTTGFVSPSIRDAELNGVTIHTGDYIGFVGKEMIASCPERADTARKLLDHMLASGEKYMLTVFCGKDADSAEAELLQGTLEKQYPNLEVYFVDGGQEIYPYIFAAE